MGWLAVLPKLVPVAVEVVERLATGKKGKDKQDEAVGLIAVLAPLLGGGLELELLRDDEVQKALRAVIDDVVKLHNAARDARQKRAA